MYETEVKVSKEKSGAMGTVIEVLKGDRFRVRLDNGHEILAEPSGRMQYYIRILRGQLLGWPSETLRELVPHA
jgi:translation initiation factor IF-1